MSEHDSARSLSPGDRLADYRIDVVIGRGGMGLVYRAWHDRLQRMVAIKVIAPEVVADTTFRIRFEQESLLAAQIEHPNVVPVYEVGESEGLLFLVMRYIEGVDVGKLLRRSGRLEPRRAASMVNQVAAALDAAHARGLVHRDVKPGNMLLSGEVGTEHVYLTDFGISKRIADGGALTATGLVVGTVDYVAPEQVLGRRVDARSDVYALGCVFYELLTGVVPFPRDTDVAKLFAHVNDPPPAPRQLAPAVPSELETVVTKAMAKEADDRYQSAGDLGRAAIAGAEGLRYAEPPRSVATGLAAVQHADREPTTGPREPAPAAGGGLDIDVTNAPTKKLDDRQVSAGDLGAAAIARAKGRREAKPVRSVGTGLAATQKVERERSESGPTEPKAALPERPPRRPSRPWILVLVAGTLAAALAAFVIAASGSDHTSSTNSTGGGQSGNAPIWKVLLHTPPGLAIEAAGVAAYSGDVWVVGGAHSGGKNPVNAVYKYDPGQRQWLGPRDRVPQLPHALAHAAVVSTDSQLYAIGGYGANGKPVSTVYRLDSPKGPWLTKADGVPQLRDGRSAGAAAWDGTQIVFAGGHTGGVAKDDVWALMPQPGQEWVRVGALHPPRDHLAAVRNGDTVWFVGGSDTHGNASGAVDIVKGNKVTVDPTSVDPIRAAAAIPVGSGFCTIGGHGNTNDGFIGKPQCQSDRSISPLNPSRADAGAAVLHGFVYVIGGYGPMGTTGRVDTLDIRGIR